jgi:histidyl-tRNA synthetase
VLAESLRDQVEGLRLLLDAGPGSFRAKLKRADRSGSRYALILGDDELASERISIKNLRETVAQRPLAHAEAIAYLNRVIAHAPAATGSVAELRSTPDPPQQ